jgi:spore coat protein H
LFSALHDASRTNDPSAWRARLENVFDTEVFLKYLAVNTVIQNWDTYGRMTHNYYLYNNPGNGKLTWIPWDNNEALQTGKQGGALALDFSDLQSGKWPLIEYLYDDEVYRFMYDAFVRETIEGPFNVASVQSVYDNYAALIEPYATTEVPGYTFLNSSSSFAQEIVALKQHATARTKAAENYLK